MNERRKKFVRQTPVNWPIVCKMRPVTNMWVKLKVECFPSHLAHRAALISDSMTLSQAPPEAARPWTRGQCVAWCACLPPALRCYQICCCASRKCVWSFLNWLLSSKAKIFFNPSLQHVISLLPKVKWWGYLCWRVVIAQDTFMVVDIVYVTFSVPGRCCVTSVCGVVGMTL